MIAVHGAPRDETTIAMLAALARRGAPVCFINQAEVLSHFVHLEVDTEVRGRLQLGDQDHGSSRHQRGISAAL